MHRSFTVTVATLTLVASMSGCAELSEPTPATPTATPTVTALQAPSLAPDITPSPWAGRWHPAAALAGPRIDFDAVVLGDGRVLIVGDEMCVPGGATPGSERTEVYEPERDAWTEVGSLNKPRNYFAMVRMASGGAFVIGGVNAEDVPFSSTKQFAIGADDTWRDGPLLDLARVHPLAVTLPDGSTVVVSHIRGRMTMERLPPTMDRWRPGAPAPRDVDISWMVALDDGRVLASAVDYAPENSDPAPTFLIYEPDADRWRAVGIPDSSAQGNLVAAAGGAYLIGGYPMLASDEDPLGGRHLERFDASTESWRSLAPSTAAREAAEIGVLADGRIVVAGGSTPGFDGPPRALSSVEIYDPTTDRWEAGPDLLQPRYGGHLIPLDDGSALVLGGQADFNTEGDTPWCPSPDPTVERWMPDPMP